MSEENSNFEDFDQIAKDAQSAIWVFIIINIVVLAFYLFDGLLNEIVFVLLFIQAVLFSFWLLPVFCYQVFAKKVSLKFAVYKALASYKEAMGYVSW